MWERKVFLRLLTGICELQEPSGKRKFLSDLWVAPAGQSEVTMDFIHFDNTFMQISVRACEAGGAGGGETATGTFSREKRKLPFSCLTRKSCALNDSLRLKCLEMPHTQVTHPSNS